MTVTATQVGRSANELVFLINHDGAGGDTLALANSVLVASLVAGPLKELLEDDAVVITQALARQQLLGQPAADTDLTNIRHANVLAIARDGVDSTMEVDADQDAVTGTRSELNLTLTAAIAANHILRLRFAHTLVS